MKLDHVHEFEIEPVAPYDFELTVRSPAGWPTFTPHEIWDSNNIWTTSHLSGALTGIRLGSRGTVDRPRLIGRLFHEEKQDDDTLEEMVDELRMDLAADEDLNGFYDMAREDPILRNVIDNHLGMHHTSQGSLFPEALLAITLQMTPMKRSAQMMDCIVSVYGERAEFDSHAVRSWPRPSVLAGIPEEELKQGCKLGYRAKYMIGVARRFEEGFPHARELLKMTPDGSRKLIMGLPGIGAYSADIINPHRGFPIDSWSVKIFSRLFHGEEPEEGRAAIEEIRAEGLRRWGRWSWNAFFYIVQDLDNLSSRLGIDLR
jgi:N-glycosylase/DNA lyase